MLRFSIREMVAWTLAIAIMIAWVAEHRRLNAANASLRKLEEIEDDYDTVVHQIEDEGFRVVRFCAFGGPIVTKPLTYKAARAAIEAKKTRGELSPND